MRLAPSNRQLAGLAGEHGRHPGGGGSAHTVDRQNNRNGAPLSVEAFACMLETCRKLRDRTQALHLYQCMPVCVVKDHGTIANELIAVLIEVGCIHHARHVFDRLLHRDVLAWSSLIVGYVQYGEWQHALTVFQIMQKEASFQPTDYAFVSLLKACIGLKDMERGMELHILIAHKELLKANRYVGNALVHMYIKCGSLSKAQEVFYELPNRDVVLWTTLIGGYVDHAKAEEALQYVKKMKSEGFSPNTHTLVCSLKACSSLKATNRGQEIHTEITMKGFESELIVGNALLNLYATCGLPETAKMLLSKLPVRDVVSWTAMIDGYAEHGYWEEAVDCLEWMHQESIPANAITFACVVKACRSIGAIEKGHGLHSEIIMRGFESELCIGSNLISMYVQSGMLAEAQFVFDKLSIRDTILWSALIAGYSEVGESRKAFSTFNKMLGECMKPELGTFAIVLNAFNHEGVVEEGLRFFKAIQSDYAVTPILDHYTIVIDLLGRSGQVSKALSWIEDMPYQPDYVQWCTVLRSSRKWGDLKVARYAFESAVTLNERGMAAYVIMSNIYGDAAMYDEANKVEALRAQNQGWENILGVQNQGWENIGNI